MLRVTNASHHHSVKSKLEVRVGDDTVCGRFIHFTAVQLTVRVLYQSHVHYVRISDGLSTYLWLIFHAVQL